MSLNEHNDHRASMQKVSGNSKLHTYREYLGTMCATTSRSFTSGLWLEGYFKYTRELILYGAGTRFLKAVRAQPMGTWIPLTL